MSKPCLEVVMMTALRGMLLIGMCGLIATPAHSYIAVSAERLTLPEVMLEFTTVHHLRIEKFEPTRGIYICKLVETLQGQKPTQTIRQVLADGGQVPERFKGLVVGDEIVCFQGSPDRRTLNFCKSGWYLTVPEQGVERFTQFRDDFRALFTGNPTELIAAVRTIVEGGRTTVRVASKGIPEDGKLYVRYDAQFPHRRYPALDPMNGRVASISNESFRSANPVTRQQAIVAWAARMDGDDAQTMMIINALTDSHVEVRAAAAFALGERPLLAKQAIPKLIQALKDEDRFVCAFAARALGQYGAPARGAIPALREALADRNYDHDFRPHRAAEAAESILRLSTNADDQRPALELLTSQRMLNDERIDSEGTRTAAARALGRCGIAAKPALPQLVQRLKDPLPATRIASAEAILLIGGNMNEQKQAVEVLFAGLKSNEISSRIQSIRACERTNRREAKPRIQELSQDTNTSVREVATATLNSWK